MLDLKSITKEDIYSINSDYEKWAKNVKGAEQDDFKLSPGETHYRLFSYISTLLPDGSLVCDIGTRTGLSAYAFAFNQKINVITYDIREVPLSLKNVPDNIERKYNDVLSTNDLGVLDADLIFTDIDPHNGLWEFEFYNFLLANKFKGITIWDDCKTYDLGHPPFILDMYNNFLSKVPDTDIIDLTNIGFPHGTTAILFGNEDL